MFARVSISPMIQHHKETCLLEEVFSLCEIIGEHPFAASVCLPCGIYLVAALTEAVVEEIWAEVLSPLDPSAPRPLEDKNSSSKVQEITPTSEGCEPELFASHSRHIILSRSPP